jgi:hypothetical protein
MRLRRHLEHTLQDVIAGWRIIRGVGRRTPIRHSRNLFFLRLTSPYHLRRFNKQPHTGRASGGSGSQSREDYHCAPSLGDPVRLEGDRPPGVHSRGLEQKPFRVHPGRLLCFEDKVSLNCAHRMHNGNPIATSHYANSTENSVALKNSKSSDSAGSGLSRDAGYARNDGPPAVRRLPSIRLRACAVRSPSLMSSDMCASPRTNLPMPCQPFRGARAFSDARSRRAARL